MLLHILLLLLLLLFLLLPLLLLLFLLPSWGTLRGHCKRNPSRGCCFPC